MHVLVHTSISRISGDGGCSSRRQQQYEKSEIEERASEYTTSLWSDCLTATLLSIRFQYFV